MGFLEERAGDRSDLPAVVTSSLSHACSDPLQIRDELVNCLEKNYDKVRVIEVLNYPQ